MNKCKMDEAVHLIEKLLKDFRFWSDLTLNERRLLTWTVEQLGDDSYNRLWMKTYRRVRYERISRIQGT